MYKQYTYYLTDFNNETPLNNNISSGAKCPFLTYTLNSASEWIIVPFKQLSANKTRKQVHFHGFLTRFTEMENCNRTYYYHIGKI
jgi:hypothetical protein